MKTSNQETTLSTMEMIEALSKSKNENIALKCSKILSGETTIEHERKYAGGFLFAVLSGKFEEAIQRADKDNELCLKIAFNKKLLEL